MTSHCHGLHDNFVNSLMSLRFVLFVQSLVFCSVFSGPLFVLSVILRLTTSDYNLGISKLFLQYTIKVANGFIVI
jgi:hypothetical protein